MFLQCVSSVIIVYIIISPLNSYLYIHWILDFKINIIIIMLVMCPSVVCDVCVSWWKVRICYYDVLGHAYVYCDQL